MEDPDGSQMRCLYRIKPFSSLYSEAMAGSFWIFSFNVRNSGCAANSLLRSTMKENYGVESRYKEALSSSPATLDKVSATPFSQPG